MLKALDNIIGIPKNCFNQKAKKTFPYTYKVHYKNADGKRKIQIINSHHNLSHEDVKGMTVKAHGVFIDIIKIEVYKNAILQR